ncbi:MAG: hypothetical protein M3R25_03200 [Bacteroidota bacterium]|nr:hypothetical protein [Bacteroidota bacterium]
MKKIETFSIHINCFSCTSCKIGTFFNDIGNVSKDAKKISADFKSLKETIVPIDTFTMNATAGVLTELSSAQSEEKLDSIASRLSKMISVYLNDALADINTAPVGNKLVTGAMDTLLAAKTQRRIQLLIDGVSRKAGNDISRIINGGFNDLTSSANKAKLNSLMLALFNANSADSLSYFINRSLSRVDYESIGAGISNDIFASNLRPQIDSIARTAVRSIFDEIRKDNTAQGFFSNIRNIIFLGLGLLGVLLALLFWWNRRKSMQMNRVFLRAIESLEHPVALDVKKSITREAMQKGVLKDVDALLKKEQLLGRGGLK